MIALVLALLACMAGPAAAVAHAMVHAHVAEHHGGWQPETDYAPSPVPMYEDGHHGHAHGHATVDTAPIHRYGSVLNALACDVRPVVVAAATLEVDAPRAEQLPALLPRPGPELGPPLGPRAPPQR